MTVQPGNDGAAAVHCPDESPAAYHLGLHVQELASGPSAFAALPNLSASLMHLEPFFRSGFGCYTFCKAALMRINALHQAHHATIDSQQIFTLNFATAHETERPYPLAKIIDMIFFQEGSRPAAGLSRSDLPSCAARCCCSSLVIRRSRALSWRPLTSLLVAKASATSCWSRSKRQSISSKRWFISSKRRSSGQMRSFRVVITALLRTRMPHDGRNYGWPP